MNLPDIRRAGERALITTEWLESRCSFNFGPFTRPGREHFGALRVLNEDWIEPGSGFGMHPHENIEILLMPLQAETAHEDSLGNRVNVRADELLLIRAGSGIRHSQINASHTERDHHMQIWLLPRRRGAAPALLHRHFEREYRQDRWELWASGHGEPDVPAIDADARIYRSLLADGVVLAAPCPNAHSAYLHVITGRLQLWTDLLVHELRAGDGLAWSRVGDLRILALRPCELLFVEQTPLAA